jgi:hypothetical protein
MGSRFVKVVVTPKTENEKYCLEVYPDKTKTWRHKSIYCCRCNKEIPQYSLCVKLWGSKSLAINYLTKTKSTKNHINKMIVKMVCCDCFVKSLVVDSNGD